MMGLKYPVHAIFIITAAVFQVVTICLQIWAMETYDITKEWYTANKSGSYFHIQYGPPKWLVVLIWALIYMHQIIWTIYTLSTLWRKAPLSDKRLYYEPYFMPVQIYGALLLNLIFQLAWAAKLSTCTGVCPVLQLGSTLTIMAAFAISARALVGEGGSLYRLGASNEVWLVRLLVHNGFACYATWELIDLTISLSGIMVRGGYGQKEAYVTMLGILGLFLIPYVLLDLTLLDIYLRYTIAPYVTVFLYFVAIVAKHPDSGMVYIMAALLLAISLLGVCFKVLVLIARKRNSSEPIPLLESLPRQERKSSIATRLSTRMPVNVFDNLTIPNM